MSAIPNHEKRLPKWYFGGLAAAAAVCFTHPLDLLKVILQTQPEGKKLTMTKVAAQIVKNNGIMAFYSGLSGSILWQLTYSTMRFAIYESIKERSAPSGEQTSFPMMVFAGAVGGSVGGLIGTPTGIVSVRMQNDTILPPEERRNYRHVFHGLWSLYNEKNFANTFARSASMTCLRCSLMAIGQLSFYDKIKITLLHSYGYEDNAYTHLAASLAAACITTLLTHPIEVIKTRVMNEKPEHYQSLADIIRLTAQSGPLALFRGIVPTFIRLCPQTVFLLLLLEEITLRYGRVV